MEYKSPVIGINVIPVEGGKALIYYSLNMDKMEEGRTYLIPQGFDMKGVGIENGRTVWYRR